MAIAANFFSWAVEGKIGGIPKPDFFGSLEENLILLRKHFGIGSIWTLTPESLDVDVLHKLGFEYHHFPIEDFQPPTLEQMLRMKEIYENSEKPIAVHCFAGVGRTGTVLAIALVIEGMSAKDAIAAVRKKRPGSIETIPQEDAVVIFEQYLKKQNRN